MRSAIFKDKDGLSVAEMQVGEKFDWPYLAPMDEGDTVASYTVEVTGPGLSELSDGQQGQVVYVFVEATAVSTTAKIRYTVLTLGGRTFVDDLYINVV